MKSLWNDENAARCDNKLAVRAYSSRRLGSDPTLVLHGGGNTSIKLDNAGMMRAMRVSRTFPHRAHPSKPCCMPGFSAIAQAEFEYGGFAATLGKYIRGR